MTKREMLLKAVKGYVSEMEHTDDWPDDLDEFLTDLRIWITEFSTPDEGGLSNFL